MSAMAWARALRPHQWVKNVFVLAPLVFAKHLTVAGELDLALGVTLAFCLASSAVYIINDTLDIAADRVHPTKRHRPIAAGHIGIDAARVGAAVLAATSLALAALMAPTSAWLIGLYLAIGVAYSWRLKHIAVVDAFVIASGFLLRVLAGGQAINVAVSPWLLGCTGLLALLLGLGKRAHELTWAERQAGAPHQRAATRAALVGYNVVYLRRALWIIGGLTTVIYALYTRAPGTVALFGTTHLVWTIPFPALGLGRFIWLALGSTNPASPTETMLKDPWILGSVAAWGCLTLALVYG